MTVFSCPACGVEITRPVELLDRPPPPPEELLGGDGAHWVPVGRYLKDSHPYEEWVTMEGGPIVNEADLVNTRPDKQRWAGCCGPTTGFGPNLLCANGHHVGTVVADCTDLHGVWLTLPPAFTLVADQVRTTGLVSWGDEVVVLGQRPMTWSEPLGGRRQIYLVSLDQSSAAPLVLPPGLSGLSVASSDTPLALCRDEAGRLVLVEQRDGSWSSRPVPQMSGPPGDSLELAADEGSIVVLGYHAISRLRDGRWTSIDLLPPPLPPGLVSTLIPDHLLLVGDDLYLGYDCGEWGGAVLVLNVSTGAWRTPPVPDWGPVTGLAIGPDRKAWVTMGLAHLGTRAGALGVISADSFEARVTVGPDREEPRRSVAVDQDGRAVALPGDGFYGLAFDESGRLHVLTELSGVLRQDPNGWALLTPAWPGEIGVNGLALHGRVAVISTAASGVLLWDLVSGKNRAVNLGN